MHRSDCPPVLGSEACPLQPTTERVLLYNTGIRLPQQAVYIYSTSGYGYIPGVKQTVQGYDNLLRTGVVLR